jgi:hypothetical protein
MKDGPLPEPTRREIFAALVDAQDSGSDVAESRQVVAARFSVSVQDVRDAERRCARGLNPAALGMSRAAGARFPRFLAARVSDARGGTARQALRNPKSGPSNPPKQSRAECRRD